MTSINKKSRKKLYGRLTENLEGNTNKINTIQSTKFSQGEKKMKNTLKIICPNENDIISECIQNDWDIEHIEVYKPSQTSFHLGKYNNKCQTKNKSSQTKNNRSFHRAKKLSKTYFGSKTSRPTSKIKSYYRKIISSTSDIIPQDLMPKYKTRKFF